MSAQQHAIVSEIDAVLNKLVFSSDSDELARPKALCQTKLEEARMWAEKIYGGPSVPPTETSI